VVRPEVVVIDLDLPPASYGIVAGSGAGGDAHGVLVPGDDDVATGFPAARRSETRGARRAAGGVLGSIGQGSNPAASTSEGPPLPGK
jgi:hypothetical protein